MSEFRHAASAAVEWRHAVEECLARIGPFSGANLGAVYFTEAHAAHAQELLDLLRQTTGVADWIGSVGMGVCASGVEYFDEPGLALMLAQLPPGSFQVFSGKARPPKLGSLTPAGAEAAYFALVHAHPGTPDLDDLVEDMAGKLASGYLVGAISSSRGKAVQIANAVYSGGLSGVVLSAEIEVHTRLTQGCVPIGPRHTVTECDANVIGRLDNEPALDVLKHDIGELFSRDLNRIGGVIFAGLPIAGSDTGDYLVRNLVGIDLDRKLLAIGQEVSPGTALMFCKRDGDSARTDLERMLGELRASIPGKPKGALYYSCVARGRHLFGEDSAELRIIRDALGEVPLVGFFGNGEISHDRLYGYTGVLTLFV